MAKAGFISVDEYIAAQPEAARLLAEFEDELATYEVEKGMIRFPLSVPVPVTLIERAAQFRAPE